MRIRAADAVEDGIVDGGATDSAAAAEKAVGECLVPAALAGVGFCAGEGEVAVAQPGLAFGEGVVHGVWEVELHGDFVGGVDGVGY